jgi:hypothetical protein
MEDGEEGDGENDGDGRVWAAEEDEGTGSDDEEEEEGEEEEDEESDGAESEDLEEGTPACLHLGPIGARADQSCRSLSSSASQVRMGKAM